MKINSAFVLSLVLPLVSLSAFAGATAARNPPSACTAPNNECSCATGDGAQNKCIKVTVDMGVTTPWTGMAPCALKVFADDQSPMVFTPDSLYAVCGYTFKRIGNAVLSDGVTPSEVVLAHPNGESVRFVFTDGEPLGRPDPGFHIPMDERLMMVDAQGWACTGEPVYYDLYETDGTVRRFLATDQTNARGRLVSVTDSRGVVTTAPDMGIEVVYGPDGVRQFLTPSRLADVRVFRGGYTVTVYPVEEPPAKDPATGLYPLPDYGFNPSVVSGEFVKNAIIYGRNGIGKSALGIALFDVVSHLTDNETIGNKYLFPYCNLNTGKDTAHFKFVFEFDGDEIEYEYAKRNPGDLAWEKLYVNGDRVIDYDYASDGSRFVDSRIIGGLNVDLPDNKLSVVKYIYRNLPTNTVPPITRLVEFCQGMLWYRSLSDGNDYAGFQTGSGKIDECIYSSGRLAEFEKFLRENGVDYRLSFEEREGQHVMMVSFASGRKAPFDSVASTGTKALRLFFHWKVVAFSKLTFLFIDEFDAFLHFESAASIVRVLNSICSCQTVVTSHNVYLMRNDLTRPDCCYIMTRNKVVPLCRATTRILREGHNLEKMYVSGAFLDGEGPIRNA